MRRRKLLRLTVAGGSVTLGAAGLIGAVLLDRQDAAATSPPPPVSTAEVVRTDLVSRTEVAGTLGYARTYPIAGTGPGTLTWLPKVGAQIHRGQRVYEVDGHRVPLFYGATPLWRTVQSGVEDGKDVLELERNLKALGYGDDLTVDRHFTYVTAAAVREWQEDLGVPETGRIAPGDVVLLPGKLRIASVDGVLGTPAGGTILSATDTVRQVTVDLPVTEQELAKVGGKVLIELPGGRSSTGRVSEIGTAATAGDEDGSPDPGAGTESATIPVSVTLDKPSAAGRLDGAPVTVGFTGDTSKDVLAVPVNALLAAVGGGYQVEVVQDDGGRRLVAVQLGIFADGQVEVSGAGLEAGMRVGVPRS